MNRIRYTAWLAGLISLLFFSQAGAWDKLENGKERIDLSSGTSLIQGGFSAAGGISETGLYAAVLAYDLPDPGSALAVKMESAVAAMGSPRRLVLATREGRQWNHTEIASADRINGPVCPKEITPGPIVVWTQFHKEKWELCVYRGGKKTIIATADHTMRNPLTAFSVQGGLIVGCETDTDKGESVIILYDEAGSALARISGCHGSLAAMPVGWLLLTERSTVNAIWLEATVIRGGKLQKPVAIRGPRDYTFNSDLAVDPASGAAFIVAECAVAFGADCQLGLDRELRTWRLSPGTSAVAPYPDNDHALIPVERRGFKTGMGASSENTPPIRPIIRCQAGRPFVAFREFRCRSFKDFGWDIYLTRCTDQGWSAPVRLTEQLGSADTGYSLLPDGADFLGIFPELNNPGNASPSYAHHVALQMIGSGTGLPVPSVFDPKRTAAWRTSERFTDIAPAPPVLSSAPDSLILLWGDPHAHTSYSKCVSSANGMPDEMIRYQRDVLKLDIISLLEHTSMMSLSEYVWGFDRLEAEACGRIVLYGTEPGFSPGRHTNIYTCSRDAFDRICTLFPLKTSTERVAFYTALLKAIPEGEVVALRHFHGDTDKDDKLSETSFEPKLEVAMEAMQGRGNNLLGKDGKAGFPSIYLNHGFKIGLVGGSDHFRETEAVNHYCLTGFWVRERSAAGVWEALRNRRTLAVSNAKVAIWATLDGKGIGEEVVTKEIPLRFHVTVSSARPIRRVTLIRDGVVLPWTPVDGKSATLTLEDKTPAPGNHWYVVTVEAESAYPQPAIAHASPIFVRIGKENRP